MNIDFCFIGSIRSGKGAQSRLRLHGIEGTGVVPTVELAPKGSLQAVPVSVTRRAPDLDLVSHTTHSCSYD